MNPRDYSDVSSHDQSVDPAYIEILQAEVSRAMLIEYELARVQLKLDFVLIRNHTLELCRLRGFTSSSHQAVLTGCVNSLDMLDRATDLPLHIFESFQADIARFRFETYMVKPSLRVA